MKSDLDVRTIGVVGCGVIGMSWAAYFLAKGFTVRAVDQNPDSEIRMIRFIDDAWEFLEQMGLGEGADKSRISFSTDLDRGLSDVDFVQENGPERLDLKRELFRNITHSIRSNVIVASSSSGTCVSDFQADAINPERILLGHPFNPPHVIPLVEVAGGKLTSAESVEKAIKFYSQIGKKPILLNREIKGHIANRIQAAVMREVLYLLEQDVASLEDLDIAISHGPGLRWAILGQFMNGEFGGGDGGIRHMMTHLGPALETWWADLGRIEKITPESIDALEAGVYEILRRSKRSAIISARDSVLMKILQAKDNEKNLPY
ncbi:3-hydroxyacyl-CoA dehydrogenase [Burkholderia territorii]|uniref:3-hydroxyacyl-CoA dehydrogenase n=1 Tax=Burkholderia territorii TaxID=1503055 RepID=A0A105V2I1_9BURK|nr:3-hydroxyacyl-CoA dehydrogenase NAD-binding domain-containing protein [Burkholderia territorii]KVV40018.1 3-hydroxyacyl-CoA dehydrogenase [Burkholderia territorii]KVX49073.1 3-hydroxyacyl-CoA dehydrogenase [Burkholderia territorii]